MTKVPEELRIRYQIERQRGTGTLVSIHEFHQHEREWYPTGQVLNSVPGGSRPGRVAPIIMVVDGQRKRCYGYGWVSPDGAIAYIRMAETYRTTAERAVASDEVDVEVTRV
jgi:hypothetical protein